MSGAGKVRSMRARLAVSALALSTACGADLLSGLADATSYSDAAQATVIDTGVALSADAGPAAEDVQLTADAEPALDVASAPDAEPAADAAAPSPDAAAPSPDAGVPTSSCHFEELGSADKPRVVLVGQPFTNTPGTDGTIVRTMLLPAGGGLLDVGVRLDVGFRPERIEFVPSGEYALVLGGDGDVASVRVVSETNVSVVDVLHLPRGGFGDLRVLADGRTAFALNEDVGATSGLYTVQIGCDGRLSDDTPAFYNLRLASSMAFAGAQDRAVVLGGQAVFAPMDPHDLRLFSRANGRWTELGHFDLWMDHVDAGRIAVSPDGQTLIVPNGSPFSTQGGTTMVATVSGMSIGGARLLPNTDDAREAIFSPDGATALVTLLTPGRVLVLADRGAGFVEVGRVGGIGLADQIAMVARGGLSGRVLLPSVDPAGDPNVASLQITGPGTVMDLGQVVLGPNSEDIPGAIAVQP